jgi:hypothetical protein
VLCCIKTDAEYLLGGKKLYRKELLGCRGHGLDFMKVQGKLGLMIALALVLMSMVSAQTISILLGEAMGEQGMDALRAGNWQDLGNLNLGGTFARLASNPVFILRFVSRVLFFWLMYTLLWVAAMWLVPLQLGYLASQTQLDGKALRFYGRGSDLLKIMLMSIVLKVALNIAISTVIRLVIAIHIPLGLLMAVVLIVARQAVIAAFMMKRCLDWLLSHLEFDTATSSLRLEHRGTILALAVQWLIWAGCQLATLMLGGLLFILLRMIGLPFYLAIALFAGIVLIGVALYSARQMIGYLVTQVHLDDRSFSFAPTPATSWRLLATLLVLVVIGALSWLILILLPILMDIAGITRFALGMIATPIVLLIAGSGLWQVYMWIIPSIRYQEPTKMQ